MRNEELAKYLPKRTPDTIQRKANNLGLKKKYIHHFKKAKNSDAKLWLKQKELLKKLYPTTSNEKLAKKFGRSKAAIANLAWKMGLHKEGYNPGINRTGGNARLWSKKEDALIRKLYPAAWTKDLAAKLNRTDKAVIARAIFLGVRKDPEKFTQPPTPQTWNADDIKKARELWLKGYSKAEIAKMIGKSPNSVAGQIQRQVRDFGLTKRYESRRWTKKEDDYLIRNFRKKPLESLSRILGRTIHSIRSRAGNFDLREEAVESWTSKEIGILKKHFKLLPKEELAKKLGRTPSAVQAKALKMGLRKN
ncbi:MAG: terminase gpP N-terminus-related DNA-binding protein [Sedimentisphaerales bacterium]